MKWLMKKTIIILSAVFVIGSQLSINAYAAEPEVKWLKEEYDNLSEFNNGIAEVYNLRYEIRGFINAEGNEIIPLQNIGWWTNWFTDDIIQIPGPYHLYGLINKNTGEVIKPLEYEYIGSLSEGLAKIRKDTKLMYGDIKWGYIDENGEIVLPIVYDRANDFKDGFALVKKDEEWHFIDKIGKEAVTFPYNFDEMGEFHNGMAWVKKDGKYGYMNDKGKIIIPLTYGDATDFTGDYAAVEVGNGTIGVKDKSDRMGIIDKTGNVVVPFEYDHTEVLSNEKFKVSIYSSETYDFVYSILDKDGKVIIPFVNSSLDFNDGLAVIEDNEKYGYIDENNNIVVPIIYDSASNFKNGLAFVDKDGKKGIIDINGNPAIPFKYNNIIESQDGFAIVSINAEGTDYVIGSYLGVIDENGKEIVPLIYHTLHHFKDGLAQVGKYSNPNDVNSYKVGFVDKTGKLALPIAYDDAKDFSEGIAVVEKDGKYGFIDKTGKIVVPIIYDEANSSNGGIISVKLNGRWGILQNPVKDYITALPTSSKALVNGREISFDAYNINGNNYFKLRDLAAVFSGTEKQFEVNWDNDKKAINLISNNPYTAAGGELTLGDGKEKLAVLNTSVIYKDGKSVKLTAYNINGNNYFKLRDICKAFNIGVTWDGGTNTISLDSSKEYVD